MPCARSSSRKLNRKGCEAVLWTEMVRYDETPMLLRLTDSEIMAGLGGRGSAVARAGQNGHQLSVVNCKCKSTHVAKLLNTERCYSMLFRSPSMEYFSIKISFETPVQSLSRTTGEVMHDAVWQSKPNMGHIPHQFLRRQRIVTTDGAGDIRRSERNLDRQLGESSSTLKLRCEVHIVYGWYSKLFGPLKHHTDRMVHAARALLGGDGMRSFRAHLRHVISHSLVYRANTKPSNVDLRTNKQLLDVFLEPRSGHIKLRRTVIMSLANGCWANRFAV